MISKVDKDVSTQLARGAPVWVIVEFDSPRSAARYAEGCTECSACRNLPLVTLKASARQVKDLRARKEVLHISLDHKIRLALDSSVPAMGVHNVRDDYAYSGAGVRVAVIDTGIDPDHPDFQGRISAMSFGYPATSAVDSHGHGTHVAGIIAGDGQASSGYYKGVAPEALLLSFNAFSAGASDTTESAIIEGIDWALSNGAQVINLSVGGYEPSDGRDPLSVACNAAVNLGAVVVAAAGNEGPHRGTIGSPGAARDAITVGNVLDGGQLNDSSSRGPTLDGRLKPDLSAPGTDVIAARLSGSQMGTPYGEFYQEASGTSMAAPHVSGLVALMFQANKNMSPFEVKQLLLNSCNAVDAGVYAAGRGTVDAQAVFEKLRSKNTVRMSTALRNLVSGFSNVKDVLTLGVIDIYDGEQPLSADHAPTGKRIARITQDGLEFSHGQPQGGLLLTIQTEDATLRRLGVWKLNGLDFGKASWFRWKGNAVDPNDTSPLRVRLDGAVGSELFLSDIQITPDTHQNIAQFSMMLKPQ